MGKQCKRLRSLLSGPETFIAPGVYDALTAKLAQGAGYQAAYLTGAGVSYTLLGTPDLGLVTLEEMAARAGTVCDAIDIPLIADGDTGYGNALNVMRTVRMYEKAGAAGIQLEDQQFPKRCGHMSNKSLISAEEMAGKIKAAADARRDGDFIIIARTDARSVLGLEAALERAERYAEAGADVLFVESPQSVEELQIIGRSLQRPLMANMVEGGRTPIVPVDKLREWGFKLVIFPNSVTRVIAKAAADLYEVLYRTGTTETRADRMVTFGELNEILGLSRYQIIENQYSGGTDDGNIS